jgi:hypothetical protein
MYVQHRVPYILLTNLVISQELTERKSSLSERHHVLLFKILCMQNVARSVRAFVWQSTLLMVVRYVFKYVEVPAGTLHPGVGVPVFSASLGRRDVIFLSSSAW